MRASIVTLLAVLAGCGSCGQEGEAAGSDPAGSTGQTPKGVAPAGEVPPDAELYPVLVAGTDEEGSSSLVADWGYVTEDGEMAIEPRFSYAEPFAGKVAWAQTFERVKTPFGPKSVGRWGLIDRKGQWVKEPTYHEVGSFENGYAWVYERVSIFDDDRPKEPTSGFADATGEIVLRLRTGDRLGPWAGAMGEGGLVRYVPMTPADGGGESRHSSDPAGYVNEDGQMVIEPGFSHAGRFSEGLAPASPVGVDAYGYIDPKGEMVIEPRFERAYPFSEGLAVVVTEQGYGAIDREGEMVIEPEHGFIGPFSDGRARFRQPESTAWGYLDREGEVVAPGPFERAERFEGGRAVVSVREDAEGDPRYGLIDMEGQWVLEPQYAKLKIVIPDGALIFAEQPPEPEQDTIGAKPLGGYVDAEGQWVYGPVEGPWYTKMKSATGL